MIKLVALFRFRAGMKREEAISYYETRHVPLVMELFPGCLVDYRRNYFLFDKRVFPDHIDGTPPPKPPFDMMTELWFNGQREFDQMMAKIADPTVGARLAADEANFLDRTSMTMFLVDEYGAPKAAPSSTP